MKKKEKRNNKKVGKKLHIFKLLFSLALLVLIMVFSSKAIVKLVENPTNTIIVKQGKISKEETIVGYIIRDETVVKGENYKNGMEKIVDEGSKVAKGESIFRYYSQGEDSLKKKIEELDIQIEEAMKNSENDLFSSDIKMLDNQIDNELIKINQVTSIQEIQEIKRTLNNYITKKAKIAGEYSPKGSHLNNLINERNQYERELTDGSEYILSSCSGVVSYRIDGMEEVLTIGDMSKYNEEFLNGLNLKTGQIISSSNEQGKVINNFICYIAFTSKTKEAIDSKVGDVVKIVLPSGKCIKASIDNKIDEDDNKVTIILKFTEGIEELSMHRKNTFEIIWWNEEGYKVPNSSLIYENDLCYVNRIRMNKITKVLVKVKKQGEYYSIISNYSVSELNEMNLDEEISTSILLYDEIILKPNEEENE